VIKENVISKFEKPVIIVKQNQVLLSIFTNDYSFISESHLSEIFGVFADHHIKVNMMQTSALSFTACIDYAAERFDKLHWL
jgi:aspartate kinase